MNNNSDGCGEVLAAILMIACLLFMVWFPLSMIFGFMQSFAR